MASVEVWQSCNGISPTLDFVMAFFQIVKVVVAWIQFIHKNKKQSLGRDSCVGTLYTICNHAAECNGAVRDSSTIGKQTISTVMNRW